MVNDTILNFLVWKKKTVLFIFDQKLKDGGDNVDPHCMNLFKACELQQSGIEPSHDLVL